MTQAHVDLEAVRASVLGAVRRDYRRSRVRGWWLRASGGVAALAIGAAIALPASGDGLANGSSPTQTVASLQSTAFTGWHGGSATTWLCASVTEPTC